MTDKEQVTNSKEQTNGSLKNQDKNFNENFTQEKEQIIIDGVYINACLVSEKCKEFETCNIKNILRQLARKTQEYQNLADILRDTDTYSRVCSSCRDDILLYPSISGRTSYTDNEVDRITLRRIINELKNKTQECEKLKEILNNPEHRVALTDVRTGEREIWRKLGSKAGRYRKALEEIEAHFEHRCNICRENYGLGADCAVCWKKDIKDIINKAKGEGNV